MSSSRQLAAIMFTDIVGYTALMGEDEEKAFELLRKNRQIQKPLIQKFNGKWLKEVGDGVLASFTTVTDAVYCAREIQETCRKEDNLKLRIGIHQGEVVFEADDVFGDGVNIASRLEALAPAGGIWVSEAVERNIQNKKGIETSFVREEKLKNVKSPVKIYQVNVEGIEVPGPTAGSPKYLPLSKSASLKHKKIWFVSLGIILILFLAYFFYPGLEKESTIAQPVSTHVENKSIAVLPFKNFSGDPELDPFCDGMTDAVISRLTKIGSIAKVISQTTMLQYKESKKSIPEIANELGVTHILTGSFQIAGSQAKIALKLIDGSSDDHIWSENHMGEWDSDDIFNIQSKVAENVATNMEVEITSSEIEAIQKNPTTNLEAYRLYLQGQFYVLKSGLTNTETAITMFEKAISLDPDFALAYAALARTYVLNLEQDPNPELDEKAYVAFQQALTIDPDQAEAYVAKANWYWTASNNFNHENAIIAATKAIELKPGLSTGYEILALAQVHVGLHEQALINSSRGLEIEPTNMWLRHYQVDVYLSKGDYSETLKRLENIEEFIPHLRLSFTAQALFFMGDTLEAEKVVKNGLLEYPDEAQLNSTYAIILASQGRYGEANERLALAIKNEKSIRDIHHLHHNVARVFTIMGKNDEAVIWLIKAAETGLPDYPLYNNDPILNKLKGDPEFDAFMADMKVELEYYQSL